MSAPKNPSSSEAKERPKLFRALGKQEPPESIDIQYRAFHLVRVIKHDSWAATALYESRDTQSRQQVVCKFNRTQPIGILPMKWLGRRLARRENSMYQRLADVTAIATGYSEISSNGKALPHASAHDFIEGHPLRWHDRVDETFFDRLQSILEELHSRNIAYVDMNKSENVIVNANGEPCLIDFQISVHWPRRWSRWLLRILQRSDLYHCAKLKRRFRPDLLDAESIRLQQPWWIRIHRKIANPFRACRRKMLVMIGVRKGKGKPQSEAFIEEALQADGNRKKTRNEVPAKPILRLYALLRSNPYLARYGATHESYVQNLYHDLLGKRIGPDDELLKGLLRIADHDRVVDLLKSKAFFERSHQWDSNWLLEKIQMLECRLSVPAGSIKEAERHAA